MRRAAHSGGLAPSDDLQELADALLKLGANKAMMPIFADEVLFVQGTGLGVLLGAPAAGFLAGSMILLAVGDIRRKGVLVLVTFVGYAGAMALFAVSRSFLLSLFAIALVGAFDGVGVIMRQTTLQLLVPEDIRGRATAALQITSRGAPSMGYLVTGMLASAFGAPNALLIGAFVTVCVAMLVLIFWREVTRFKG